MRYSLKMPTAVYGGEGALEQIPAILKTAGVGRVALFTDRGVLAAGLTDLPLAGVKQAGAEAEILCDLPAEPTYGQVQALVDNCRDTGADCILAVGGGSVMDAAKLASVLGTGGYTVHDLLGNPSLARKTTPTIMVPTTAGTGAEATPNAIVAVPEEELKVGIVSEAMIADHVILDAKMTQNLPRPIAAATGLDALAHAIECFTGNKATPFSDLFALEALRRIFRSILPACAPGEGSLPAKQDMLLASFYAGVAITASGTTAVHALSYPLGGKYHIAHGVSNAMLLAPVMRFNAPACEGKLAQAYDACFAAGHEGDAAKAAHLVEALAGITRELGIPQSLQEAFGVPPQDLDGLVAAALQVTRLLVNNPRPVTEADARALYSEIL